MSRLLTTALTPAILAAVSGLVLMPTFALAQAKSETKATKASARTLPAAAALPPAIVKDAERVEAALRSTVKPTRKSAVDAMADGLKLLGGAAPDLRGAAALFREAVVLDSAQHAGWMKLGETALSIKPDPQRPGEAGELALQATGASARAYEKARTVEERASALALMADALARRGQWRPAITALKASVAQMDVAERRARLATMVAEHGFRIVDVKTDSDATSPRACVQFSDPVATGKGDLGSFLRLDGKEAQSVTADGQQICIDGLKHGQRYEIQVRAGLPSTVDEVLPKSSTLTIGVRDRTPSVRATAKAYVLPRTGQQGIPLSTINTDAVDVEVYRIGDRSLAQTLQNGDFQREMHVYDLEQIRERSGQRVYKGLLETRGKLNEEATTAFPVTEAVGKLEPGVYLLSARVPRPGGGHSDDTRHSASQWFIVSDLGVTAYTGTDGIHAFVRSLESAEPVAGTTVRLVARNNEILGEAKTDARGYVRFDPGLRKGEGGLQPALVSATTGEDYAFLDLSSAAFDLTDRGVKGRDAPGPVDAFSFADRGVYRPGETVHFTTLVRDGAARPVTLPVTLVVTRPDGVEHSRQVLADLGLGGRYMQLKLGANAMTGTWRLKVHTDPKADAISSAAFLVEDFVPERMDMTVKAATPALTFADGGKIEIAGRYLYGPPAANLGVEADVSVKASSGGLAAYPGYRFGASNEKIVPSRKTIEDLPETDEAGRATLDISLPEIDRTQRLLEADVVVRLRETSGRTIERSVRMPVRTGGDRIGIKPLFGTTDQLTVGQGETVGFDTILLDGSDKQIAAQGLKWQLVKLENRWQWYNRDGSWSYDVRTTTTRIADGVVDAKADAAARISARVDWGRYRIEVTKAGATASDMPVASSVEFTAGYWHDEAADSPEQLDIALDKPSYKAGETARVRIQSREGGRVQIAVLGSGLVQHMDAVVPAGGGDIEIPVTKDWGGGAYVAATLFRPMAEKDKRMPGRAIGIKWLPVDPAGRALTVTLDAPAQVKPSQRIEVPVKIAGLAAGEEARVVVAATDAGILNLTRYQTPQPGDWFFGQKKLGYEMRDFYSRLIDGMKAERGRLRSGGDGGAGESMSMSGSPPVEGLLALHSGVVTVGSDGVARVAFDLPDFNGTVRLTAVAWSADKVGSASKDVVAREAVALTVGAPRFLTLGDEARLLLDIHNVDGPTGAYKVTTTRRASAQAPQRSVGEATLTLKPGEKLAEKLTLKADATGVHTYDVAISGPGGLSVNRSVTLDVKPPAGIVRRSTVASLKANGGKLTLGADAMADLIADTTRATITVGPMARLNVPGLLAELDRYPYGCAEQTTSRALPLLYANDVARLIGLGADDEIRGRISGALTRLYDMQDSSGAFGIWGPSDGDLWLTSYVTDFLVRAREAGHTVNAKVLGLALDRLANSVAYAQDFEKGGETRAYAIYVLARAGKAPASEIRYYVDSRLDRFATPLAMAQLGAAASYIGDRERAERAFAAAMKKLDASDSGAGRQDYGTGLRDGAALLTLASESRTTAATQLVDVIAKAYAARAYTSTQEQAWMLLAAKSLGEEARSVKLAVNGEAHSGRLIRALKGAELKSGSLVIENTSDQATDVVVSIIGSALTPEPAIQKGFRIERQAYTLDGKAVDLASLNGGTATVAQNDRFVMVVKVTAQETGGRVLLVDPLPAGFEIENPRIVDSGQVKSLGWLETARKPEHTEFRDDRFIAAFDFFGARQNGNGGDGDSSGERGPTNTATVAYIVRAVTPGTFVHPASTVEDMYRPERHARTAAGKLTVTAK